MVRVAKSNRQKRHNERKDISAKRLEAVKAYRERQALAPSTPLSIRAIAREFGVNHSTLGHDLDPNCRTIDDFNASKTKLSAIQEAEVVRWAVSLADRNLALTSTLIHEHASLVYQSTNPGQKLGKSWTTRFLDRHQDELARHWSRPLDKVRAMSATPVSMKRYFDAYKSLVGEDGKEIPPHRQFAYDECGVQRGHSQVTRVISSRHNKAAKVNKGGSRELITFIPIISGSGELVTSVAVFPGKLLREGWVQNNPGNYA
jgi:Tc5 transposase DNA-binding domain